jgi:hypothetical protein
LSDSSFSLEMTKQKFPTLKFHYKSEFWLSFTCRAKI